ncbi:hypothetical protein PFMALIP_04481 [Plasmodium falciparum MaliPS096_E11]|uniref:Uncharacterized protein n=1 Tax=Plasmodium falciparum MaliPS096_E11 TaxID=1036727 RepID=A0A024WJQ5_PLAFA|nr:hypothetical protein PFMALIP_04481 [Plasmodium falciparum MaliPS096_E11]
MVPKNILFIFVILFHLIGYLKNENKCFCQFTDQPEGEHEDEHMDDPSPTILEKQAAPEPKADDGNINNNNNNNGNFDFFNNYNFNDLGGGFDKTCLCLGSFIIVPSNGTCHLCITYLHELHNKLNTPANVQINNITIMNKVRM